MAAEIINGNEIAKQVRAEVAEGVAALKASAGVEPGLAVVLVGDDPASAVYVRNKGRAAEEAGIYSETYRLSQDTPQDEVVELVRQLNADERFHGILVQLPLPPQVDEEAVLYTIDPSKDVDGLHPFNLGRLAAGNPSFVPCTPAGVQEMLVRTGHDPAGKHVVVCGRSNIVGKPVSLLLLQKAAGANATVTVCHTGTRDLGAITRQGDILIAAAGRPGVHHGGHGQGGRRGGGRGHQPRRRRDAGARLPADRRRGLRAGVRGGVGDHAGAGRRRPDDHRHAAQEHAAVGAAGGGGVAPRHSGEKPAPCPRYGAGIRELRAGRVSRK